MTTASPTYHSEGPRDGSCGHSHSGSRGLIAAARCAWRRSGIGHAGITVVRADGVPLTSDEYATVEREYDRCSQR